MKQCFWTPSSSFGVPTQSAQQANSASALLVQGMGEHGTQNAQTRCMLDFDQISPRRLAGESFLPFQRKGLRRKEQKEGQRGQYTLGQWALQ